MEDVVHTGEENEELIYTVQGVKLSTFGETMLNKGTGTKTWNECGNGDVRILKNEYGRFRLVMRDKKTGNVHANHSINPAIVLTSHTASDRTWI